MDIDPTVRRREIRMPTQRSLSYTKASRADTKARAEGLLRDCKTLCNLREGSFEALVLSAPTQMISAKSGYLLLFLT